MSRHHQPRRALLSALIALALTAPAATAGQHDLRYKMHTSSLAGTHATTPADVNPAQVQPQRLPSGAPAVAVAPAADSTDGHGIAPPVVVLTTIAALTVGILAGTRLRRRRPAVP